MKHKQRPGLVQRQAANSPLTIDPTTDMLVATSIA
jgi:hypothetical protein